MKNTTVTPAQFIVEVSSLLRKTRFTICESCLYTYRAIEPGEWYNLACELRTACEVLLGEALESNHTPLEMSDYADRLRSRINTLLHNLVITAHGDNIQIYRAAEDRIVGDRF